MFLAWLNFRGVLATLTFNLSSPRSPSAILVLFVATPGVVGDGIKQHAALPYGWVGALAAMHFGFWVYLGIESTTQAAEKVRSPARSLPSGTPAGIMTQLIAATLPRRLPVPANLPEDIAVHSDNAALAPRIPCQAALFAVSAVEEFLITHKGLRIVTQAEEADLKAAE